MENLRSPPGYQIESVQSLAESVKSGWAACRELVKSGCTSGGSAESGWETKSDAGPQHDG